MYQWHSITFLLMEYCLIAISFYTLETVKALIDGKTI